MKKILKLFPQVSESELRRLLHMTGSDYEYNEPLFRNYANLRSDDSIMLSLLKKKLVRPPVTAEGYAANAHWFATKRGLDLSKAVHYAMFGEKLVKNLRKNLNKANGNLNDAGMKYYLERED